MELLYQDKHDDVVAVRVKRITKGHMGLASHSMHHKTFEDLDSPWGQYYRVWNNGRVYMLDGSGTNMVGTFIGYF